MAAIHLQGQPGFFATKLIAQSAPPSGARKQLALATTSAVRKLCNFAKVERTEKCTEGWKEAKTVVATSRSARFHAPARNLNSRLVLPVASDGHGGALRNLAM